MDQTRIKRGPDDQQKPGERKRRRIGGWVLVIGLLTVLGALGTCGAIPHRGYFPQGLLANALSITSLVGAALVVVGFFWWMIDIFRK